MQSYSADELKLGKLYIRKGNPQNKVIKGNNKWLYCVNESFNKKKRITENIPCTSVYNEYTLCNETLHLKYFTPDLIKWGQENEISLFHLLPVGAIFKWIDSAGVSSHVIKGFNFDDWCSCYNTRNNEPYSIHLDTAYIILDHVYRSDIFSFKIPLNGFYHFEQWYNKNQIPFCYSYNSKFDSICSIELNKHFSIPNNIINTQENIRKSNMFNRLIKINNSIGQILYNIGPAAILLVGIGLVLLMMFNIIGRTDDKPKDGKPKKEITELLKDPVKVIDIENDYNCMRYTVVQQSTDNKPRLRFKITNKYHAEIGDIFKLKLRDKYQPHGFNTGVGGWLDFGEKINNEQSK